MADRQTPEGNGAEESIASLKQGMLEGRLSCIDIVERSLARIGKWDGQGPALRSLLTINSHARDIAVQRDAARSSTGKLSGPLHGIPVVLKDNIGTSDLPTTAASKALGDFTPAADSTVVRRLGNAGAVILAKANLHEFALGGLTVSSLGGQTRNPYDLTRTPGGSSGGSAVAVAMDFCTVALGTDTVNSIRSPASANCLVGLRPTCGLVSRAGVLPVSDTQDAVGPMARSVQDVALVMDVLAGYDPEDPVTARSMGKVPASYLDYLDRMALRGKRLGLLQNYQGTESRHNDVNRAMADAIKVMRAAGAEVVSVNDPFLDADRLIRDYDVQKWEFRALLNRYLQRQPNAPVSSLQAIIASGRFHKETLQEVLNAADAITNSRHDLEYLSRLAALDGLRDRLLVHMADQGLDALIYPLQKCLVAPIGSGGQPERNGILAALTGFPALNVPVGFSAPTSTAPLGVPIGMDILARPFDEPLLLGLGYAYEQMTQFRRAPVYQDWPA